MAARWAAAVGFAVALSLAWFVPPTLYLLAPIGLGLAWLRGGTGWFTPTRRKGWTLVAFAVLADLAVFLGGWPKLAGTSIVVLCWVAAGTLAAFAERAAAWGRPSLAQLFLGASASFVAGFGLVFGGAPGVNQAALVAGSILALAALQALPASRATRWTMAMAIIPCALLLDGLLPHGWGLWVAEAALVAAYLAALWWLLARLPPLDGRPGFRFAGAQQVPAAAA